MHAVVSVNGVVVGAAADQFLRYAFDLRNATRDLLRATNVVEVAFAPGEDVGGRFMACTGGWDWAPYSHTFLNGSHLKGLWRESTSRRRGVVVDRLPSIA
ncbi:beta-mannosidase [Aureococcus anophagefferens]|nr:beta-mannosidase [Aureococcus anophagefferens]